MLQRLHTYCPFLIYLLVFSYAWMLGNGIVCELFHSIAYTAKVMNAGMNTKHDATHLHTQEVAEIQLAAFLQAQEEREAEDKESLSQQLEEPSKIVNTLKLNRHWETITNNANFPPQTILYSCFQTHLSPPPQLV